MHNKSLYQIISEAVVNGELPRTFSLPPLTEDENELRWADGALDGVTLYHMGIPSLSKEHRKQMERAVQAALELDYETADHLFETLGKEIRALCVIDELQEHVITQKEGVSPDRIFQYGMHALKESEDREVVKFGLSLLELLVTDGEEEVKEAVRTIGLSDEFSLFAIFILNNSPKPLDA